MIVWLVFWGLCGTVSAAQETHRETIDTLNRAFGYTIGDLVTRRITVRGDAAGFTPDLLPETGPLNAWLALRRKEITRIGDDVELILTYQLTGADTKVTLLELPAIELKNRGQTLARIDAYPISVSPIIGARPFVRTGLGDMRPAHEPLTPDFAVFGQRLVTLSGISLSLLGVIGWRRWRRSRNDRLTPFAHARRALRQVTDPLDGYRILHRAFDQSAGRSLFLEDLGTFLTERPRFQRKREPIEQFFRDSREVFFGMPGDQRQTKPLTRLRSLARSLARLEGGNG